MEQLPPLVAAAEAVARQMGFPLTREEAGPERASACLPGVGRFLAVLAAGCVGGRIGELGTERRHRSGLDSQRHARRGVSWATCASCERGPFTVLRGGAWRG